MRVDLLFSRIILLWVLYSDTPIDFLVFAALCETFFISFIHFIQNECKVGLRQLDSLVIYLDDQRVSLNVANR